MLTNYLEMIQSVERDREALLFSFARHGRALAGESPEHAQVVGNV